MATKRLTALAVLAVSMVGAWAGPASAQWTGNMVKIGVLSDMSSV